MAKIVVLEDEASTRALITGVLKKHGHEVIGVDNGAEGLLVVLAEQPALVISDVQMPKLSGFEVLAQLRQDPEVAHTPVILLTSLTAREDIQQGLAQGADDYITKPFAPADLLASVNARLEAARANARADFAPTEPMVRDAAASGAAPTAPAVPGTPASALVTPARALYPAGAGVGAGAAAKPVAATQAVQRLLSDQPEQQSVELPSRALDSAWVMHVSIANQAALAARLPARDWRLLIRTLYSPSGPGAALKTASYVDLADASLTTIFTQTPGQSEEPALRAARAVAAMVQASGQCARWVATHFATLQLPAPLVHINLHLGAAEVASLPLDSGGSRELVLGPTVDMATGLRHAEGAPPWAVMATEAAVLEAKTETMGVPSAIFRTGASAQVRLDGRRLGVVALTGLDESLGGAQGVLSWA